MAEVIVGMSGGVDSSVTAYLLKEQGYAVEGVSFTLYEARMRAAFAHAPCCSLESVEDAKRTAEHIGVSHTIIDLRDEFLERVIEPFIEAYSRGLTPNPCILCNKYVKFPFLIRIARERGAQFIATGHYARSEKGQDSCAALLKKGVDQRKDQSYVLYALKREELRSLILPLGTITKDQVRRMAAELNLPAAKRPESQEICFIEEKNYSAFLKGLAEGVEGPIIHIETGKVLGTHKGIHLYTIGQRKRLGVASLEPLFVAKIDPSTNTIYVGPREAAMAREFVVGDMNWLLTATSASFQATVKVRSTMKDEPATIEVVDMNTVKVLFDEPQWAPAPGQSAVFYKEDTVLGGGIISPLSPL